MQNVCFYLAIIFATVLIDFQPDMQTVCAAEQDEEISIQKISPVPEFPGGRGALFRFLTENIQYPEQARKDSIQGCAICQFDVQADGSITDIVVVRSSGSLLLDKEAIRVLSTMPNWEWNREPGKYAPVKYTVPVNFKVKY